MKSTFAMTLISLTLNSTLALAQQPNIIVFELDDATAADIDSMPNVQAHITTQGTVFTNAIVPVSLCCPSRASLLRGQAAHNHGVLTNLPPDGGYETFHSLGRDTQTIGTWMQAAGYKTALFGKYLNGYGAQDPVPPGWDNWQAIVGRYVNYRVNNNGRVESYGSTEAEYETDVYAVKITSWIKSQTGSWFAYVAPSAPHRNCVPPGRYSNRYTGILAPRPPSFNESDISDKAAWLSTTPSITSGQAARIDDRYRGRLGTLLAVDDMVKTILDTLAAIGEIDSTYIFFTSDNGFEQGEHRILQGKQTPYEECIRVPLLVRGPGVVVQNGSGLISNIDLAPTFLEIGGGTADIILDGRSFLSFLHGMNVPWRSAVLVEHTESGADTADEDKYIPTYQLLRTRNQVYVEYPETSEKELYNLRTDPFELQNIASTAPGGTLATYGSMLATLKSCVGSDCFPIELTNDANIGSGNIRMVQSYPNPFNPMTQVRFTLEQKGHVTVRLFNILGQEVIRLLDSELESGEQHILVDGQALASGLYFCHIETETTQQIVKLALVK